MTEQEARKASVCGYWRGKNIPQQWYSTKEPLSVQWFNEIARKRYEVYYAYLKPDAEFEYHGNEDVLEVGCGLGTDLAEYAGNGARVSGVDLGEEQVELTRTNLALRGLPYQELKQGDAENLPFEDESFDLVYSFGVLHHTPNTEKAIGEIERVLKSDGHAIVMLYARGWKHYLKRCLLHGLVLGKWFKHKCNWQLVYNEVSEVHGESPKTGIYTRRQVQSMFKGFDHVVIRKRRLGEFIEYPPYQTFILPGFVRRTLNFLGLESILGENWLIKAHKTAAPPGDSLFNVLLRHY